MAAFLSSAIEYFLIAVTILLTFLMNAEIPLFALKFKTFGFKENALKYVFLANQTNAHEPVNTNYGQAILSK